MDFDRFERLLQRIEKSEIALLSQLDGCSEQEVAALESRYSLQLPQTYTVYLRVMGHKSGRLFTCDHMATLYRHVLEMTAEVRQMLNEPFADEGSEPPQQFELPEDILVIAGRLGEQFAFIRCRGQDDSPVWYFNIWEWQIRESSNSVLTWLENWCAEAERAIANGYFDLYPEGTSP